MNPEDLVDVAAIQEILQSGAPVFHHRRALRGVPVSPRAMQASRMSLLSASLELHFDLRVGPVSPAGVALQGLDAAELTRMPLPATELMYRRPPPANSGRVVVHQTTATEPTLWVDEGNLEGADPELLGPAIVALRASTEKRTMLVPVQISSRPRTLAFYAALADENWPADNRSALVGWWSRAIEAVQDGVDMLGVNAGLVASTKLHKALPDMTAERALDVLVRGDDRVARVWVGLAERVVAASKRALLKYMEEA